MGTVSTRKRIQLVGLGVLLALVTIEGALRLGGWILETAQSRRNLSSLEGGPDVRILCVGESTTALGGSTSYPRLLEEILNERSPGRRFGVVNAGRAGTVTDRILERLRPMLDRYEPQVVVSMMGINDPPVRRSWWSPMNSALGSLRVFRLYSLLAEHLSDRLWPERIDPESFRWRGFHPRAPELLAEATRLRARGDAERARAILLSAAREYPRDLVLHAALESTGEGDPVVGPRGGLRATEERLRRWLAQDPDDRELALALVRVRVEAGRPDRAVEVVRERRLEERVSDPRDRRLLAEAYQASARVFGRRGNVRRAEADLRSALRLLPDAALEERIRLLLRLARVSRELGAPGEARAQEDEAARLKTRVDRSRTAENYRALARILRERGVQLVAAQYPLRDPGELERLLSGEPGVIVVDNRAPFERALRTHSYRELFSDSFAGDFGHLTEAGRRLLAQDVAEAILRRLDPPAVRFEGDGAASLEAGSRRGAAIR